MTGAGSGRGDGSDHTDGPDHADGPDRSEPSVIDADIVDLPGHDEHDRPADTSDADSGTTDVARAGEYGGGEHGGGLDRPGEHRADLNRVDDHLVAEEAYRDRAAEGADVSDGDVSDGERQPAHRFHVEQGIESVADLLRSWTFWLAPILAVLAVMTILGVSYIGAIVNPEHNLHDFHIALVNQDVGGKTGITPDAPEANFGNQVADGIVAGTKGTGVIIDRTSIGDAFDRLDRAKAYGVVIIPSNFTSSTVIFGASALTEISPQPPTVDILYDRRQGAFASSITQTFSQTVQKTVNEQFGQQLSATVREQAGNAPISGAAQLALSQPVRFEITEANPLPDSASAGLTAFYYTIMVLLAGFTGAMVVHTIVDSTAGFTPYEFGPIYQLRSRRPMSRWGVLMAKWLMIWVVAVLQSTLYIAVCKAVGMYMPNVFELWLYSVLAITAIGFTAMSVSAVFGPPGLILNLIFFVILGLPASGGALPLQASPRFFGVIAHVEPMHQVYLGVRSILFFDGSFAAGLGSALIMTVVGLVFGLLFGLIGTKYFDHRGWDRLPGSFERNRGSRRRGHRGRGEPRGHAAQHADSADETAAEHARHRRLPGLRRAERIGAESQ